MTAGRQSKPSPSQWSCKYALTGPAATDAPSNRSWSIPTPCPVMDTGIPVNGHQDESAEGKQSLFSWAEFLAEEPVQPTGRRGKTKPAAPSLFEWALNAEQDREKEPVGAGR